MIFNEVFHLAARTIDALVDKGGLRTFKVGHDKACILALVGDFCLADDAFGTRPGLGLVIKRGKKSHRGAIGL